MRYANAVWKKGFRRHLCAMRTITLCFDKANRTYGLLKCAKQCRLKKGFRRHLCGMRTITLCFGKANRTYGLLRFAWMCKTKQCRLKRSDGIDKIIESAWKHQLCTLMPAVIWFWLVLFKNEEAKSLQQPQQVATPNWACKSPSVLAPAATVSWIWRSVIALQMQTNIMCSFCSRIGMRVNIICLCEYKCKPFLLQALKM